jgi:ubiquinone/menaquinone biosynthesis C-methylase UbiE
LIIEKTAIEKVNRVLDIGAGNGAKIIKLAKKYPNSQFIGIDYWGDDWEYSKIQCETNALIENVGNIVHFEKASASNLPYSDNSFDTVVSCLVFLEVKDEPNKVKVVEEALRVVKANGSFVFMDLFKDQKVFGCIEHLNNSIKKLNLTNFSLVELKDEIELPRLLLGKRSLGNAMLLYGVK